MKRSQHHEPVLERFTEPAPLEDDADVVATMAHQLKTRSGRTDYGLRKQTVEPVFGIIKHAMEFRQFLVRGVKHVGHEWNLVAPCMEHQANEHIEHDLKCSKGGNHR